MATYNGEKYLREQIDSLFAQTCQDWHLYVHDDGSSDGTVAILKEYNEKYHTRITLMDYPSQGGACKNFLSMLERVEAPYYMFCDQDDVWLQNKIEVSYKRMEEEEIIHKSSPIVVNTDLTVVDKDMNEISKSFWNYERIYPKWIIQYEDNAAIHSVTGCTMLFNDVAKKAMKHPFDLAEMHDIWITLSVHAIGGIISYIEMPTILYRQHGCNTLGARDASKITFVDKLLDIANILKINTIHYKQMNFIRNISVLDFIKAKIRYKKLILRKNS